MAFSDPVELVIARLTVVLSPVPVVMDKHDPAPPTFVQVLPIGGQARYPVRDSVRMDVWTWALTNKDAMDLALQVRTEVWNWAGKDTIGVAVYQVEEFLRPRPDIDPVTLSPRVWATYQLTVRENAVISPAP